MGKEACTAFAEIRDGEVVLLGLDGAPFPGKPEEVATLLLSRLDCDVKCLELPPVAEREIPALIRYRLRSVYPGSLERAAIDHVTQRHAGGLVAVVFIVDAGALGKIRAAAPRAVLGLAATVLLHRSPSPADGWVTCDAPGYTEILRFEEGVLLQSVLVKRDGAASEQRVHRLAGNKPAGALTLDALGSPGPSASLPASSRGSLRSLGIRRRRPPALFRPPRRFHAPRPAVTRAALAAAIILLGVGLVQKQVNLRRSELALLRHAIAGGQAAGQRSADLAAQYSAAGTRVAELLRARPVDVYQFFTDLRDELGPGVLLQDLVLQDGGFQLQAIGPSPLALMQRFITDPRFQSVRLLQTTPLSDGFRQQFIVTGRYTK